jgi:hypothetical protein
MFELKDGSGNVAASMPVPSTWKFGSEGITGPNGIVVKDFPLRSFMDNYNPSLQQAYAQTNLRSMPGIDRLIREDFIPWGNTKQLQYVRHYEIPEISKIDKWYSDQLYKAMPSRSDVRAYGIEWKKENGDPYFTLVHLNVSTSDAMQNWYYLFSGLDADRDHFDAAKKQYIFSLANTRYNLEPIAEYNRKEMQRVGANWQAFNQRMARNQAAFEAQQRAFVNKSEAVNEAIMRGWKERNAASDREQEQRIDRIYERTNVQSTETGKLYKVDEGYNQYWMNRDGEYIGTQMQGYDPNLDENLNEMKWEELKQVKL